MFQEREEFPKSRQIENIHIAERSSKEVLREKQIIDVRTGEVLYHYMETKDWIHEFMDAPTGENNF